MEKPSTTSSQHHTLSSNGHGSGKSHDATLLPEREFDVGSVSNSDEEEGLEHFDEEDEEDGDEKRRGVLTRRRRMRSTIWVAVCVLATVNGRRLLTRGFPYPAQFILLVQLGAYAVAAIVVLLVKIKDFWIRRKRNDEGYTMLELFFIGFRILLSSSVASIAMLCGAQALFKYPNFPVIAMLPIMTYAFDSILFRLAHVAYMIPGDYDTDAWAFPKVLVVLAGVFIATLSDYRLNDPALGFALAAYFFASLSKVISKIGPRIEQKGTYTWETPFKLFLLAGIPPLLIAAYVTGKYENVVDATSIARSWTLFFRIFSLGPAVILQLIFASSMNMAYPFISEDHIGGALEEDTEIAKDASASTLQAGFWTLIFGVIGRETNLILWMQVLSFTTIYIITVSPNVIAYYPPRLLNLLLRILRRRTLPIHAEPWQFLVVKLSTSAIFFALISINTMFWVDTIAYNHSLRSFLGPKTVTLDSMYRPPVLRSFDIVIAHSAGDPIQSISDLISTFATYRPIASYGPKVKVYTQDKTFNLTTSAANDLRDNTGFEGQLVIQTIRNIGGPSTAFLHHILYVWDSMPTHTLFLSTSSFTANPAMHRLALERLRSSFIAASFPLPDALPKTGFLNLGEMETCSCGSCVDKQGWEDSFHLMPSMFAAARPGTLTCDSVLLTHSNAFIASAARLRGLPKEIFQLLSDALTNEDLPHAWAHDAAKLPKMRNGEEGRGRWGEGGVYATRDSADRPWLGFTVERLWGVLLQCSEARVAWRCPSLERGWRGGEKEDCGCID